MAVLTDIGKEFVRDGRMGIEQRGDQLLFYVKALAWTPIAIKRYRREIWNTLAEVAFGGTPSQSMQQALNEKGIPWRVTKTFD